ncbi:unnamed protein product [Natator depressus]
MGFFTVSLTGDPAKNTGLSHSVLYGRHSSVSLIVNVYWVKTGQCPFKIPRSSGNSVCHIRRPRKGAWFSWVPALVDRTLGSELLCYNERFVLKSGEHELCNQRDSDGHG